MSNSSAPPLQLIPQPVLRVTKAERARADIMNAALGFLWTSHFRDLTVGELMHRAGLSRSAFYQYFGDLPALMQALQETIQGEIFAAAGPWIEGVGDPVALLRESIDGLVRVSYERGPLLRALSDAAATDEVFEEGWAQFLNAFDDAATARIEADQEQGLIPDFDARPVAFALNRLDASTLIAAFGQHPRQVPEPVAEALARIWISTLYGTQALNTESGLVRS